MNKKIFTGSLLLGASLLFSACTFLSPAPTATPTPTISNNNSVDSIETELKSTVILDENFSDI